MYKHQLEIGQKYVVDNTVGTEVVVTLKEIEVRPRTKGRKEQTVFICFNSKGRLVTISAARKFRRKFVE